MLDDSTWAFVAGMIVGIVFGFFGVWTLIISGIADEDD